MNLFSGDSFIEARSPEAETSARPNRRQYQLEAALNGPLQRDRTFLPQRSRANWRTLRNSRNRSIRRRQFSRSAVSRISEGLFSTASSSTETSFKLTHLFGTAHQLTARYAFSGANISREVLGSDNFSDQSARGGSANRDQAFAISWRETAALISSMKFASSSRGAGSI